MREEVQKINPQDVLIYRNEYLNLMLLKVKSLLNYIHDKINTVNIPIYNMYSSEQDIDKSWKLSHPNKLLIKVLDILTYLNEAIKIRKK